MCRFLMVLGYAAGHRAVVQYLLSNGFNPNDLDSEGRTCIDIARMKKLPWLVALVSFPASSSTSVRLQQFV